MYISGIFNWNPPQHDPLPALYPLHRVLLRVRMLYYLKVEVLGDATSEGLEGISARYRTANVLSCHKKEF